MTQNFPPVSSSYDDDDGTMPKNAEQLAREVVGHRIVSVTKGQNTYEPYYYELTLDDGRVVELHETSDCCAFTEVREIVEHLPSIDHIITAVRPNSSYTEWHLVADFGAVMTLKVEWSSGNPFYYGYGIDIRVRNA